MRAWGLPRCLLVTMLFTMGLVSIQPVSAASISDYDIQRTWNRTDKPVADHQASRTWMWGPEPFTDKFVEPFVEGNYYSSKGQRQVQYFDKSRMEITSTSNDSNSPWYVTNGLLATELVTGRLQAGEATFQQFSPAKVNASGDPDDPNAPTYASFTNLLNGAALPVGSPITQTINRMGAVGNEPSMAGHGVTVAVHVSETNHTVPSVFWDFMNSSGLVSDGYSTTTAKLFENPFYATGFPISEPYWTTVLIGGAPSTVLIQVYQRRVLTYNPANPDGWKVEAGNVGQHYYTWRYERISGTRANPLPIGTSSVIADQYYPDQTWRVHVEDITPNANAIVANENMFNDPPAAGKQFFIARVSATYTGPGSDRFDGSYRLRAVGNSAVSYSTFENSCGVIPNEISDTETFTGGTVTGNVCWEVQSSDTGSLVMFDSSQLQSGRVYFALHR